MQSVPERFEKTGTALDVVSVAHRRDCSVTFGLKLGAEVISCYSRNAMNPRPRDGDHVHVVGHWVQLKGCGNVIVDPGGCQAC